MGNFIKVLIPTYLSSQGNNFVTFSFQNGEIFIISFYINIVDGQFYMSIENTDGTPVMEDRRIIISDNLFGDCDIAGVFSVEGDPPSLETIDNNCNIYYSYYSDIPNINSVSSKIFTFFKRKEGRDILRIKSKIRYPNDTAKEITKRKEIVMGLKDNFHKKPLKKRILNFIKKVFKKNGK